MKVLCLLFVACVWGAGAEVAEDELRRAMREIHPNQLSTNLRSQVSKRQMESHCCKTGKPNPKTKQVTKIVVDYKHETVKQATGYTKCGFGGFGRCTLYDIIYKNVAHYYVQSEDIPDDQACPDNRLICCKGFAPLSDGSCAALSDFKTDLDFMSAFANLKNQGLFGDDFGKK